MKNISLLWRWDIINYIHHNLTENGNIWQKTDFGDDYIKC